MHRWFVLGTQVALHSGHTHGEYLAAFFFCELQTPLPFQQRDQAGQGRVEAFGTHVMGRLPGQKERLLYRLTVLRQPAALDNLLIMLSVIEQFYSIFAGVARPFHARIQQQRFLGWGCLLVARS